MLSLLSALCCGRWRNDDGEGSGGGSSGDGGDYSECSGDDNGSSGDEWSGSTRSGGVCSSGGCNGAEHGGDWGGGSSGGSGSGSGDGRDGCRGPGSSPKKHMRVQRAELLFLKKHFGPQVANTNS